MHSCPQRVQTDIGINETTNKKSFDKFNGSYVNGITHQSAACIIDTQGIDQTASLSGKTGTEYGLGIPFAMGRKFKRV